MSRFRLCIACLAMVLGMASQAFAISPTVSGIRPNSGPAGTGSGSFTMYVGGANFTTRSSVIFGNCAGVMTTYENSTLLAATIPITCLAAPGTVGVGVVDSGLRSNFVAFQIYQGTGSFGFSTTSIPGGTTGTPYSATLQASGGTSPYSWALSGGTLPAGLTLSSTGVISGTPTTSGSYSFAVLLRDSAGHSATNPYSTSIAPGAPAPLTISTTAVPSGAAATAYSATLAASGGTSPYSWSVSSGALPTGLTLSTGGVISGTPSASGSYSFTAQVNDSASHSASYTYSTSVAAPPIAISTTSVPGGTVNTSYITTLIAAGGTSPYQWTVSSGALPAGLTLSSAGVISGMPTTAGSYSFTAQVNDSASHSATSNYSTSVVSPLAIKAGSFLPNGTAGSPYQAMALQATGGIASYTWTWVPGAQQDLPMGLTLLSNGQVTGTPTEVGTFSPSVTVRDSTGATATQVITFTIAPAVCTTCVQ
ncbi:MAG TPA: putative Ig domain-containing protein [Terriglobia bacterium]|nr:putative Ig domain-containing protein [Terriglobia bacterium]